MSTRKSYRSVVAEQAREEKQRLLEERNREVDTRNSKLTQEVSNLENLLEDALNVDSTISFSSLKDYGSYPLFTLPPLLQKEPDEPDLNIVNIKDPDIIMKLIPGWEARHQKVVQQAWDTYHVLEKKYKSQVSERNESIKQLEEDYTNKKKEFEISQQNRNAEIDKLEAAYNRGDPLAIKAFFTVILNNSKYPKNFPRNFRIAYVPEPKQLVIEFDLPNKLVVPSVSEYRYIKTKDTIDQKVRKPAEIKEIYQDIVAAICLRTIHEVFEGDQGKHLDVVVFNGFVQDVDPSTGKDVRPCIISIRTTRDKFTEINLSKIEKKACLRNLGAQVSAQPAELQPVKPVVEFDMVDKRFVENSDVLSDLESRPNLMDLNPWEFENLVENLFAKIGFEAKLTRSSKDGGVDVVAFDPRPILGGKVVIQAKRYKHVVGVSAVRDLYGTMLNEGASKGILVTTSHYGPDTYEFSKDKPIELIDGGGLLYLLDQNGTKARIIFPEDVAS